MDDDQGVSFEEATGQAAPAIAPAPAAAPQTAPAPGSAGRTVTVHKRAPPVPPSAPIVPHETAPVSVEPQGPVVDAVGQAPPPDEGVKFEDVAPQSTAYPGLLTDIGKGIQGGLAEGVEGVAGMGRDLPNLADYGLAWAGAHINQMTGGEDAQTALERSHGSVLRRAVGDDVYNALGAINPLPSAASIKKLAVKTGLDPDYKPQSGAGRYAHEIAAFLPGALIPGGGASLGARALQTVAPAIGSEMLGHLAEGTGYEPWARFLGAGLGGLAHAGVSGYTAPMRKSGQQDLAAELAQKEAKDPAAALAELRAQQAQRQPGMTTGENIKGSEPTPGQITGDYGQIRAERAFQAGPGQAVYGQRMGEQSAAQTKATRAIQPTGDPQSVADLITKRLQEIDAQHDLAVGARQKQHDIDTQRLTQEAQTMAGQVARRGDPEDLGGRAREALAASMAKAKEREETLWRAIDPDKKIGLVTTKIGARARNIAKDIGLQKPMEGEERAIFEAAAGLPKWTRLADVMDLSSRLKAAMRQERFTNGNSPALRRMATLNTTMENIIANSGSRASATEAAAEREGLRRMTPADRKARQAASAATRTRGNIERGPAGEIIKKGATSDSYRTMDSQVPGKVFAAGPTGGQKLKAYTAAGGGMDPVHDIVSDSLAREATTDGMIDAKKLKTWQESHRPALEVLPDEIRKKFLSGPNEAGQALAEGAAARRTSLIEHSKRDVAKEMGASASAVDRADPAFRGIIGKENAKDVQDAVGGILQRPDAVTTITRLAKSVSGNPSAADGLKRAVLDHILEKTLSQAEAGTERENMLKPGTFQAFVANNKAALKAAGLSPAQLDAFDKVAADLQRQQRFNATKTRAGSDTAQNWFKLQEKGEAHHGAGWLPTLLAIKEAYEYVPESLHGVVGAGAAVGIYGAKRLLSHLRNAGIEKAKDAYHEAVMNPDKMADLLSRPSPGSWARVTRTLKRSALYGGLAAERHEALGPHQGVGPFGRDVYVNKASVASSASH